MISQSFCKEALVYLKPSIKQHIDEDFALSEEDGYVNLVFNEDLTITFLVSDSENELFRYIKCAFTL